MRLIDLTPLHEIDFPNQKSFDSYNKIHKLRPDTKVTVAGRVTTAGRAALNTKDVKGTSVFGGDKKPSSADLERSKKISASLAKRDKDNYDNTTRMISLARAGKIGPAKSDTSLSSMIPNKATQKYDPATAFNQKVSKMTDNNDHSAAAVELAIYMDDKEAVQKLQQIKKLRDNRGYLRPSEAKERGEMVNNLLQRAQKELPKKDFDLISSAF